MAFGLADPLLTPHPDYLGLSSDPATRQQLYRRMVMDAVDPAVVESIRCHLQRQHAYGSDRTRKNIEVQLGRSVGPQKFGRPRKDKKTADCNPATGSDSLSLPGICKKTTLTPAFPVTAFAPK